jgi:hypothetical protein
VRDFLLGEPFAIDAFEKFNSPLQALLGVTGALAISEVLKAILEGIKRCKAVFDSCVVFHVVSFLGDLLLLIIPYMA